jgi:putative aminopeptidase FrvX
MREELTELLNQVLVTHSPGGVEHEMDAIVRAEFGKLTDEVHVDAYDNIYVKMAGREPGPATVVTAHKDENSLIVRKIDADGKMWVENIGGIIPVKYGEGPVDIITETEVIPGVLHMGASHCSALSSRIYKIKTEVATWDMMYLDCKLDGEELAKRGVGVGDRAVVARTRKQPLYLEGEYIGGYALDDKAAVAIVLLVARRLKEEPPLHDVYVVATTAEESGASGGLFISRTLEPRDFIAVEVGPVEDEYPVEMNEQPIVLFKDSSFHYDPVLSRELIAAGKRQNIECQRMIVRSFGSEASFSAQRGLVGRAACLCFPTENTHGYEVGSLGGMENCVRILVEHFVNVGS